MLSRKIALLVIVILLISTSQSFAAWTTDPDENLAICTAANIQDDPKAVSDGNGGAIIVWKDRRSGLYDIYAQRVDSSGAVKWAANGVVICDAAGDQNFPEIISDGNGGAIITWQDARAGGGDLNIYAQRIDSNGAIQWAANGVVICNAANSQDPPKIISDDNGGAIITWEDNRGLGYSISAQRINSAGVVQWTANGEIICGVQNAQNPDIVRDGNGGAIIAWEDQRSGNIDIYAQRVNSAGVVQWAADGVVICNDPNPQNDFQIESDGNNGAIFVWQDWRNGTDDIFAQRVDSTGAVKWVANGITICDALGGQEYPSIISDGLGGAFIFWRYEGLWGQRVTSLGIAQWAANGKKLSTFGTFAQLLNNGNGSIIFSAQDLQLVNANGVVQWATETNVSNEFNYPPTMVSDGNGGAIIAWADSRNGINDIFAQRVFSNGLLSPTTLSGGTVTPAGGIGGTEFTFKVTYTDLFNTAPVTIKVNIGGTDYNLTETDAGDVDYTDGKEYRYSKALDSGNYTYKFSASNADAPAMGDTGNHTLVVWTSPTISQVTANPSSGEATLSVTFGATVTQGTGSITKYEWDFDGDGIYDWSSTSTPNTTNQYTTVGTFTATLKVTDSNALTATKSVDITVTEPTSVTAPTVTAGITNSAPIYPGVISFAGTGTAISNRTIAKYEWDFDGDGNYDWSSTTTGNTTWMYMTPGTYTAKMKVTDNEGDSSEGSVSFTIATPTSEQVFITQPQTGGIVSGSGVAIYASVIPATSVNYVKFYYRAKGDPDWTAMGDGDSRAPYTAVWNTSVLIDREYEIKATVVLIGKSAIDSDTVILRVSNSGAVDEYEENNNGYLKIRKKVVATQSNTASTASGVAILIPYGALTSDAYVLIEEIDPADLKPQKDNVIYGKICDISIEGVTTPDKPCTITLPYVDDNNDGILDDTYISVQDLKIYHYDETAKSWSILDNIEIDTTNKWISGTTNGFSNFVLAWDDPGELQNLTTTSNQLTDSSGGGGGCFLATSAFEKSGSKHTVTNFTGKYVLPAERLKRLNELRKFRDEKLMTNASGRTFVRLYYTLGPVAAEAIRGNEPLKALVRSVLMPEKK